MTHQESLLISAYTGVMLCKSFSDMHKFVEQTLGRPVYTHEVAIPSVMEDIKEKLLPQIIELISNIDAVQSCAGCTQDLNTQIYGDLIICDFCTRGNASDKYKSEEKK